MALDAAWAVAWLSDSARLIAAHRDELTGLDRAIGDGDHGENMDRGFQAVAAKLPGAFSEPSEALRMAAMTLISTVGGAAGPLYGTAFLRAAAATEGVVELDAAALAAALAAARDGIAERGHAVPGDKTMLDAWVPAAAAAAAATGSVQEVLAAAADAAASGARATEPLVARRGRASYLGERSVGHRDPGAVSTALLLQAAAAAGAAS